MKIHHCRHSHLFSLQIIRIFVFILGLQYLPTGSAFLSNTINKRQSLLLSPRPSSLLFFSADSSLSNRLLSSSSSSRRSKSKIQRDFSTTTVSEKEQQQVAVDSTTEWIANAIGTVPILPAKQSLSSFVTGNKNNNTDTNTFFSVVTWNILLPNSYDNWWNHKLYAPWVSSKKRQWEHRQRLIQNYFQQINYPDIICLQETNGDTFDIDFQFLLSKTTTQTNNNNDVDIENENVYDYCLHNKFRFRCATFYKRQKFTLDQVANKDRVLVTAFKLKQKNKKVEEEKDNHDTTTTTKSRNANDNDDNDNNDTSRMVTIVNCHLSGGAAPDRRLRQIHEGIDQLRKWKDVTKQAYQKQSSSNRPSIQRIQDTKQIMNDYEKSALIVCGDFNSDGNTAVRHLLTTGSIDPNWKEPQYPTVDITSKYRSHTYSLVDAAELAYGANVCDGDYGEQQQESVFCRPATYIVPNLASRLLLPANNDTTTSRTQFGQPVAQVLADTLGLQAFCEKELDQAFNTIDLDGNNLIDEMEVETLLHSVYQHTYGQHQHQQSQSQQQQKSSSSDDNDDTVARAVVVVVDEEKFETLRSNFWGRSKEQEEASSSSSSSSSSSQEETHDPILLSRDQVMEKLKALQQELEGGNEGSELVEIRTDADVQRMVSRFTPILKEALDIVFDQFSNHSINDNNKEEGKEYGEEALSEEEFSNFLIQTNGQVGRGGMWRQGMALLEEKKKTGQSPVIYRIDWYELFARELGEGKWWQVVHDLEVCGITNLRNSSSLSQPEMEQIDGQHGGTCHYQGWLDYVYFDRERLQCQGVQEALTEAELLRIHKDGDALPNEWHPSDHLPVAAIFSWKQ